MLQLKSVTKVFRAGDIETTALDGIELSIDKGEYVAIMGPSGCGKSTLLAILGLLDVPTRGEYWFDGQEVSRWNETRLAVFRRQRVAFIFQSFNLLDDLTVAENVELAVEYAGLPAGERRKRVDEALARLGVGHRAGHRPSQLSGGQQQRVAIARAVVNRPMLLLADEPTGNLDTAHGDEVMKLLHDINEAGTAVVMVTHSPSHAALAKRSIQLLDGRITSAPVLA